MRTDGRTAAALTLLVVTLVLAGAGALLHPGSASAGGRGNLKVRKLYPADGDGGVRIDEIAVAFNRPVDPESLDADSFALRFGDATLPGSYRYGTKRNGRTDERLVIFTPDEPLGGALPFAVRFGQSLRSTTGGVLDDDFSIRFQTALDKTDTTIATWDPKAQRLRRPPRLGPAPKVKWSFPANGLGNVFTDDVRLRFNRAVDAGTIDETSFAVTQGGEPVAGTVAVDPESNGREVVFTPENPLFPSSSFRVVVTRDVRSTKGRRLKEAYDGSFGTSPFKEGIRPLQPEDFALGPLLLHGRAFHTTTTIDGGALVVVGGQQLDGTPLASTEVYDQDVGFFRTRGNLATARRKHAAVTLRDGRVMVCGGFGPTGLPLSTIEVFNAEAGSWSELAPMNIARVNHTATALDTGRVLVAGGFVMSPTGLAYTGTAELYDPIRDEWTLLPDLEAERGAHTATRLQDGRVLLVGGARFGLKVAEIFDPVTATFRRTLGDPLNHRLFHAAEVTRTGTVLIGGGGPAESEQFDPLTETFNAAGTFAPVRTVSDSSPDYATITAITDGRIMVLGGLALGAAANGDDLVLQQVQLWDAKAAGGRGGFFPMVFDPPVPRAAHTINRLPNGSWMAIGGFGTSGQYNERRTTIITPSR